MGFSDEKKVEGLGDELAEGDECDGRLGRLFLLAWVVGCHVDSFIYLNFLST